MAQTDDFYLNKSEPQKSCLLALREIILKYDRQFTETTKYGMPCFCYEKIAICYLWSDKTTKEPYVLFVEGKHLEHPLLEQGDRSRMKIFRVNPNTDLDIHNLESILQLALEWHKVSKSPKTKK